MSVDSLDPPASMTSNTYESNRLMSFIKAAKIGDVLALEEILKSGIDIDYKVSWPKPLPTPSLEGWFGDPAIVLAAIYGHTPAVRLLLRYGVDVNNTSFDAYGTMSALLAASTGGHVEMTKLLVAYGAKAEVAVFQGTTTPLAACAGIEPSKATENHREIIMLLLDNGYDIDASDEDGMSPLTRAAQLGNLDLFKLLLDRGANINARTHDDPRGRSALDEAACYGRLEMVQLLLDRGAEKREETTGFTALHAASRSGELEIMELLLRSGANSEAAETNRTTALHWAAASGAIRAVKLLLNANFKIEARSTEDGQTPLHQAAERLKKLSIEILLDSGANIDAQDRDGRTALHHAISMLNVPPMKIKQSHHPSVELLNMLLSRGADLSIPDKYGKTVLHVAVKPTQPPAEYDLGISGARDLFAREEDLEAVKLLLAYGADVNRQDLEGTTVLHRAAQEWNVAMIERLLSAGAALEARTLDGSTPLLVSVSEGSDTSVWYHKMFPWTTVAIVQVLLDAGANINAARRDGKTVLHLLVEREGNDDVDIKIITLLLDHGIELAATDEQGTTSLMIAERLGKRYVAQLIRDKL